MFSVLSRTPLLSSFTERLFPMISASHTKISTLIALLFVCFSAWISGQLFWHFNDIQTTVTTWSPQATSSKSTLDSTGDDVSPLLKASLFGNVSEKSDVVPVKPVIQDAPKTRLNLVLVGAVSSSDPNKSLAVIANKGAQATYGVGEKIEGTQASLKSVFIDRVIIDNSGRDETLMLEGIKFKREANSESKRGNNASSRQITNNPDSEIDADKMASIRADIIEDPQKILQYIRLSQVKKDGDLIGYRVRPGEQKILFDSAGLKNGDIAIALNGESLTDPATMANIWKSMSEMTEFNLTVERDGQAHEIYIAF